MAVGDWWEAKVVPRLIRCACGAPGIMELRAALVPQATGRVFELGCGGGLNQRFYDSARISHFAGVDPGAKLLDYARAEAATKGWQADIREGAGEAIPFDDAQFDTAVCTFTLCSVADPARVLSELRRILRPGGTLLFLEHGAAPDANVHRWQTRLEPLWRPLLGGCHLTRPIGTAIAAAGFSLEPQGSGYQPGMPRFASWMEWGRAVRDRGGQRTAVAPEVCPSPPPSVLSLSKDRFSSRSCTRPKHRTALRRAQGGRDCEMPLRLIFRRLAHPSPSG